MLADCIVLYIKAQRHDVWVTSLLDLTWWTKVLFPEDLFIWRILWPGWLGVLWNRFDVGTGTVHSCVSNIMVFKIRKVGHCVFVGDGG